MNQNTRTAVRRHEAELVKQQRHAILTGLSICAILTTSNPAKAGPFHDLFNTLRSAIAHPKETRRPHRSSHKRKKTPPVESASSHALGKQTPAPLGQAEVRWAKAASIESDEKANLPYATPVAGKPGLVSSPFAPDASYIQVVGFPPGTPVEDPYTGKIFLTP